MKKILILIMTITMVLSLVGCGEKEKKKEDDSKANGVVDIYYPEDKGVVKDKETYQIKQPDSLSASVEELMACLMDKLDERMEYHTYLIDADNDVTLQFVCNGEFNREYMLLAKAAIVETLFQIESINSVSIYIADVNGNSIAENLYLRGSFYFYDYEEEQNQILN